MSNPGGSPPRVAQLYQAEHARVFRVTPAFCGDRAIAEDATQEAFVRALERWPRLREQPWVAGWIISTALNVARRLQRRRVSHRVESAPVGMGREDPKLDPGRKLDLWTSRGGPMPPAGFRQVAVVDGTAVYGQGSRLAWRVQGLNAWVQAHSRRRRHAGRRSPSWCEPHGPSPSSPTDDGPPKL